MVRIAMRRSTTYEDYRVNGARPSAGACCWVLFRVVAVVAILVTDAATLGSAVASTSGYVRKVVKRTKKFALPATKRTTRFAENVGYHFSGNNLSILGYVSYRKGCESGCETPSAPHDLAQKFEETAVESRRLSEASPEDGRNEIKDTLMAVPEDSVAPGKFSALYKHLDDGVHSKGALPEKSVSASAPRRSQQAATREDDVAATILRVVTHNFSATEAADHPEGRKNSAEDLQGAITSPGAAASGRAVSTCNGGRECSRIASGSKQETMKPFAAGSIVALQDSPHSSHAEVSVETLEHPQPPTYEHRDLMGHSGGNTFTLEDYRLFSGAEPRLDLLENYQYEPAQRSTGKPGRREKASPEKTLHWNVSNVGQALEHVRTKLVYFLWGMRTDDGQSDNPVEILKKEVQNLFKAISSVTVLCEAERISEAMHVQHHNSKDSDVDLAAFTDEPAPTFTPQAEEADIYLTDHHTKRSRDLQLLEALDPSEVALVVTNVTTGARDALGEASALVEKLYKQPPEWTVWEAVRSLEVRIRNLHAAAGRFKNILHATRAAVRLLLPECPRLAKKAGKKGGVVALSMKVTARLYSTAKYIYIACEKLSGTIVLYLPLLLQQASLSPEDDLRLTDCFASVTEALHTAWQRAGSARVYNEKLVTALSRDAATASQSLITTAETTKYANTATLPQWNVPLVL